MAAAPPAMDTDQALLVEGYGQPMRDQFSLEPGYTQVALCTQQQSSQVSQIAPALGVVTACC